MEMQTIVALVVLLIFTVIMVYQVLTGKKDAKKIILSLVLEAERRWIEKGSGSLKYNYVIGQIKAWMPIYLRPFLSDRVLDVIIDDTLDFMKDQLDQEHLYHSDN